jgi:hypothetical protein
MRFSKRNLSFVEVSECMDVNKETTSSQVEPDITASGGRSSKKVKLAAQPSVGLTLSSRGVVPKFAG